MRNDTHETENCRYCEIFLDKDKYYGIQEIEDGEELTSKKFDTLDELLVELERMSRLSCSNEILMCIM